MGLYDGQGNVPLPVLYKRVMKLRNQDGFPSTAKTSGMKLPTASYEGPQVECRLDIKTWRTIAKIAFTYLTFH